MRWPEFVRNLVAATGRNRDGVQRPDILVARSFLQQDGRFRFLVTLGSSRNRPCDGLDVLSPDGRILDMRLLVEQGGHLEERTHELTDIVVERAVGYVFLRVRRREHGYDGQRFKVELPPLIAATGGGA